MTASSALLSELEARGYSSTGESFAIGRPDRPTLAMRAPDASSVIVKQLPESSAGRLFHNMTLLWESPFGKTRHPPGLPRPIEMLNQLGAIIMEQAPGKPLALVPQTPAHLEHSMQLLADLHNSGVEFQSRRSSRGVLRSMQRKAETLVKRAPQHHTLVTELLAALEAGRRKDTELVPSHGDFSPRNVITDELRYTVIDWERGQMADPAKDVTYFATWGWIDVLRGGRLPNRDQVERAVEAYLRFRASAHLDRQLPFHIAAGMLRRACSLVELWPEQAYLVPALLKAGLRELAT